jgi:hypothetical protein
MTSQLTAMAATQHQADLHAAAAHSRRTGGGMVLRRKQAEPD